MQVRKIFHLSFKKYKESKKYTFFNTPHSTKSNARDFGWGRVVEIVLFFICFCLFLFVFLKTALFSSKEEIWLGHFYVANKQRLCIELISDHSDLLPHQTSIYCYLVVTTTLRKETCTVNPIVKTFILSTNLLEP